MDILNCSQFRQYHAYGACDEKDTHNDGKGDDITFDTLELTDDNDPESLLIAAEDELLTQGYSSFRDMSHDLHLIISNKE